MKKSDRGREEEGMKELLLNAHSHTYNNVTNTLRTVI